MDITSLLIQLAALIGALATITAVLKKQIRKDLEKLSKKLDDKDYQDSKVKLTDFLTEVEIGIKSGKTLCEVKSEVQIKMACEIYDHYVAPRNEGGLNGNSWVQEKWEKYMKK